ncbi:MULTISPECIES: hypothetical protein [Piscirickettsiaceae]|jgi:hypothetical protein|uniref:GNAT family acetyltransferase n=1 Tax=Hydrogenovibrio thermophilus TaxID=265883 RepID=A0A410H5C8_9GAMM|nr:MULTISPECIES: hypothetical protein [Piscirickettsiaceae]AZR81254.1 hypothetical protein AYJ59_02495 [Thiomicrospira sp. S5]AZR81423.1 hypothetical protein AYJ59_03465 [Thiomicrospira sp. S5]QAB16096.1 hypothetical protein EPV75_10650 [Hydrogenovibrio thermophilus]
MKKMFELIISISYSAAALVLFAMAFTTIGWSIYEVVSEVDNDNLLDGEFVSMMLQAVGATVISVAIIDVAKYMIEEEVFRNKELRSPVEARQTITKVIVILSIAVGIEGLVFIFKAGIQDITLLVYPTTLVLAAVVLIVGLGVYQKLSATVEKET